MEHLQPLFKWFGSKYLAAKLYPAPLFDRLDESFAGCAGYSLRHYKHAVRLYDTDPHLDPLWRWLISPEATEAAIREIPLNVPQGTDIRTLELSAGQSLLLKSWQRTNNVGDCWTISKWGHLPGQWTANTRARVADQVQYIKHWKFLDSSPLHDFCESDEVTSFIDPPYKENYKYRQAPLDYTHLADLVRAQKGQVIVCEGGTNPDWLPFRYLARRVTSRRKAENNNHCREWLYLQGPQPKVHPQTIT